MRRPAIIIATVLAICLLVGLALWLYSWDGTIDSRVIRSGETVSVGESITFTVPEGWEGFYDRYAYVPSWVPLGAERVSVPLREFLTLRKATGEGPKNLLLVMTYYGGHAPPSLAGLPRIAGSEDVALSSGDNTMIAVVSGGPSPVYLAGSAQPDPVTAIRRLWEILDVSGAESP